MANAQRSTSTRWIAAAAVTLAVQTAFAVDVKIEFDKTFDFKAARTWAWNGSGAGKVMMARTPDDDPAVMQKQAEPIILDAVATEIGRRGLQQATSPDVFVTYYLLLTTGTSAQTLGQFIPGPLQWGIPPFAPGTQSLEMMHHGSLVLDFTVKETVVWRGVAQANVKVGTDPRRREALLREAVRDLLRRFPPRS
jgi:hypothetical protein